jgi:hypothetical protein
VTLWHDVSNGKQLCRACGTYGKQEGGYRVWWGGLKKGDHLEDLDVDGRVILKWIFKVWDDSMDWFDPTQERDTWKAFVNVVINLRVS